LLRRLRFAEEKLINNEFFLCESFSLPNYGSFNS
jgi:hypothetical protein